MKTLFSASLGLAVATMIGLVQTRPPHAGDPAGGQAGGAVARGEYIVNSVAMCVQCHSPRDANGRIVEERKLTGAPMPVRGPEWTDEWAFRTPAIEGLTGFTDDQIVTLLTEGRAGDRDPPRPPMPPFRMTKADAQAVVAYLRSFR
jgi:mono/diheme cytochrome c family protein